ncbi:Heavy metal-associated isoprenylated plant protein 16 [Vitis vinifera]|uniref:Heavy metal-associated isoprenylated plant protein 16 n=1 Tax=Vitis vinifera TaxID=29760 RepID=A0A438H804_VITVI|nr:Heavy metal-associated isoprenylated plant protein 16 [Vitis vinifera]
MKQKVVISVSFNGNKNCQSKALKIAAGFSGVNSTALEGEDKNQIVVVGENIDVIELVKKLKKKVGFSTLNSCDSGGWRRKRGGRRREAY